MCGISGFVTADRRPPEERLREVRKLGRWLAHRGPDAWGEWADAEAALGHNRLAILDIEGGAQPMVSPDGHTAVVFNGEIYNFRLLRSRLEGLGRKFRSSHSDTEVILNGYLEWGWKLFPLLDGMFALAIWDGGKHHLVLARDRLGIKPLYYCRGAGGALAFASEPKALIGAGFARRELRPEGLAEYFAFRAPLWPGTLLRDVRKLGPGSWLSFLSGDDTETVRAFWRVEDSVQPVLGMEEAADAVWEAISGAVESHLVADVPVGIFLSGGVDSGLIAAAAKDAKPTAYTVGTDSPYDEGPAAQNAARRLGLSLRLRRLGASDYLARMEDWAYMNDDPSGDPSALALLLLSEFAREDGMKAMLAGEGGDELFGGYNSYLRFRLFLFLRDLPGAVAAGPSLKRWANGRDADYLGILGDLCFLGTGHLAWGDRLQRLLSFEARSSVEKSVHSFRAAEPDPSRPLRNAMVFDQKVRLADDLLMRTDRATMFHGLEARVPFLDNGVLAVANRLPDKACLRLFGRVRTKILLKSIATRWAAREMIYRPKRGFDLPLAEWLRGPFRELGVAYLEGRAIPGLEYGELRRIAERLEGGGEAGTDAGLLWAWLTLEQWYRLWIEGRATPRAPSWMRETPGFTALREAE